MKTDSTKLLITLLKTLVENEGVDLNTLNIKINIEGAKPVEAEFSKILSASDLELEQMQTETNRLDFLVENRLRVERWNTSPSAQFYYVMNDEDVSIVHHENLRTAVDLAMKKLNEEAVEQ